MALNMNVDSNRRTINNIRSIDASNNIVLINKEKNYNIVGEYYFEPVNPKLTHKFIKKVEQLVRTSNEYSNYIHYLSTTQGLIKDVIMGEISSNDVDLEFHHYPFTLYDIVEIILEHHVHNKIKFTSISLAEDVMKEHFNNMIGVARLSKTNHELAHAGVIYVPLSSVFGKVNDFVDKYFDFIYTEQIEKYNKLVDIQNKREYNNSQIFKTKK